MCAGRSSAGAPASRPRRAQAQGAADQTPRPEPNFKDVQYGLYEADKLDLWLAQSDKPTPLAVFIHGGGFVGGDKSKVNGEALRRCLASGVSFASINYRFRQAAGVQDIMRDAARAIQFLRFHAKDYNLDPKRVACYGGSAGAGTSLWIAVHDDLADAKSEDPIARESTRISAAGCLNVQATYDLREWDKVMGSAVQEFERGPGEAVQFYHLQSEADFDTPEGRKILADCNMLGQITPDDPPIFVYCGVPDEEPQSRGQYVHHPRHAQAIKQKCDEVGVECQMLLAPKSAAGGSGDSTTALLKFLFKRLGVEGAE